MQAPQKVNEEETKKMAVYQITAVSSSERTVPSPFLAGFGGDSFGSAKSTERKNASSVTTTARISTREKLKLSEGDDQERQEMKELERGGRGIRSSAASSITGNTTVASATLEAMKQSVDRYFLISTLCGFGGEKDNTTQMNIDHHQQGKQQQSEQLIVREAQAHGGCLSTKYPPEPHYQRDEEQGANVTKDDKYNETKSITDPTHSMSSMSSATKENSSTSSGNMNQRSDIQRKRKSRNEQSSCSSSAESEDDDEIAYPVGAATKNKNCNDDNLSSCYSSSSLNNDDEVNKKKRKREKKQSHSESHHHGQYPPHRHRYHHKGLPKPKRKRIGGLGSSEGPSNYNVAFENDETTSSSSSSSSSSSRSHLEKQAFHHHHGNNRDHNDDSLSQGTSIITNDMDHERICDWAGLLEKRPTTDASKAEISNWLLDVLLVTEALPGSSITGTTSSNSSNGGGGGGGGGGNTTSSCTGDYMSSATSSSSDVDRSDLRSSSSFSLVGASTSRRKHCNEESCSSSCCGGYASSSTGEDLSACEQEDVKSVTQDAPKEGQGTKNNLHHNPPSSLPGSYTL